MVGYCWALRVTEAHTGFSVLRWPHSPCEVKWQLGTKKSRGLPAALYALCFSPSAICWEHIWTAAIGFGKRPFVPGVDGWHSRLLILHASSALSVKDVGFTGEISGSSAFSPWVSCGSVCGGAKSTGRKDGQTAPSTHFSQFVLQYLRNYMWCAPLHILSEFLYSYYDWDPWNKVTN